jgi:hypothetical protein
VFAVRVPPGGPTAATDEPPASDNAPATPNTVKAFVRPLRFEFLRFEFRLPCDMVEASDFTPALICNYTTTTAATLDHGGGKRRGESMSHFAHHLIDCQRRVLCVARLHRGYRSRASHRSPVCARVRGIDPLGPQFLLRPASQSAFQLAHPPSHWSLVRRQEKPRLILEIDIGERLPVVVTDDHARANPNPSTDYRKRRTAICYLS